MEKTLENNEGYTIKGIEKILEKVSKETLAKFFGKSEKSEFTQDILEMLRERNIPSGMEIESFYILDEEKKQEESKDMKTMDDYFNEIISSIGNPKRLEKINKYNKQIRDKEPPEDGRALIGLALPFSQKNQLFIYVDEPVKEEDIQKMFATTYIGGVMTLNCFMGKKFYNEHKKKIDKFNKSYHEETEVDSVLKNLTREKSDFTKILYDSDYAKRAKAIIFNLTGKELKELKLSDLIDLKNMMKERVVESQKAFADKYAYKKTEEK